MVIRNIVLLTDSSLLIFEAADSVFSFLCLSLCVCVCVFMLVCECVGMCIRSHKKLYVNNDEKQTCNPWQQALDLQICAPCLLLTHIYRNDLI